MIVQLVPNVINKIVKDVKDDKVIRCLCCVNSELKNYIMRTTVTINYDINIRFLFCESDGDDDIKWKYPNVKRILGTIIFDKGDIQYMRFLLDSGRVETTNNTESNLTNTMMYIISRIPRLTQMRVNVVDRRFLNCITQLIVFAGTMNNLTICSKNKSILECCKIKEGIVITINLCRRGGDYYIRSIFKILREESRTCKFILNLNAFILNYKVSYYDNSFMQGYDVYLSQFSKKLCYTMIYINPSVIYDYIGALKRTSGYLMAGKTIYLKQEPNTTELVKLNTLFVNSTFIY